MIRWLLALTASAALVFSACGGDGDDDSDAANGNDATAAASGTPGETPEPTATKVDQALPTPTPASDDSIALIVVAPDVEPLEPTVAEFRELPTVTVGQLTGVPLSAFAEQVSATPEMIVNIEGRVPNSTRGYIVRYALSEIADTTVFVIDENGHVNMKNAELPESEQLLAVSAILFTR